MITADDTNIILAVLIPGESFAQSSKTLLDRHLAKGEPVICEIVFAEPATASPFKEQLRAFLSDTRMKVVHSNEESLLGAGSRWAEYVKKGALMSMPFFLLSEKYGEIIEETA